MNFSTSRFFTVIAVATILLLLSSCHSSRQSTEVPSAASGVTPSERLMALSAEYASNPLRSFSVPVSVNVTMPSRVKVSGTLYVAPSQYIYFSARFLGMEVGSVMITPDSIFGKIKPGKKYVAEPLTAITSIIPVTLDQIQGLIMGRIAIPGYEIIDSKAIKSCKFKLSDENWTVTPTGLAGNMDMTYTMSATSNCVERLDVQAKGKASAMMSMTEYQPSILGNVPSTVTIEATTAKNALGAVVELNYSKLRTDVTADKTWSTPRGYSKIDTKALLRVLSNF